MKKDTLAHLKAEGNFELLLTDWNMPIMNSLELVQAMRAGVNNYVTKPFDPKTIKAKIDNVLSTV